MEISGDPDGVAALKALHAADKSFVKFILNEARSNFDMTTKFTAKDGKRWLVVFDPREGGTILVQPAPAE